ncbi:porin family protein [Aurantimonas sp. MSK8Z-1]|uniref:outer membrane protein n=1 Tax=Mangrovibrevibacter kandeliae TaxID=2968473 RepID=UPI0021185322|nr:outer membrane beta-barrel protein [Aurantimonas sp. MSK8Z-1]MCW4115944.1 porin family protein [Aurantimonas sp. MSK8Z-1]
MVSKLLLAAAMLVATAGSASAEYTISAYGGYNFTFDSNVDVDNGPSSYSKTISWDGDSFGDPPYWGVRGTYWLSGWGKPNWGIAIDYSHAKVIADPKPAGVTTFEFTDGLNLVTANALYRWNPDAALTPYVGLGLGLSVPHVEYQEAGGPRTFEYQVAGPAVQALAGVDYAFNQYFSVFGEYKLTYTHNDVDLSGGGSLETDLFTNQIVGGVSVSFDLFK